jgi:short-subunit dehydrogenase
MKAKKYILITGASTGIGRATTEYLASNGFGVYAGARKQKDLEDLDKIDNVVGIKLDVTEDTDVQAAKKYIIEQETGLFGLVNNAGINYVGPLMELSTEEIIIPFKVNLMGVHRTTRAFFPLLLKSKGRIIMMSSINGFIGLPFDGPYCVSKFALEGYSDALRRELLKLDINLSIIRPGFIKTIMWDKGEEQIEPLLEEKKDSIFYDSGVKLATNFLKEAKEKGIPAVKVAEVVFKALTSKNPKVRYLVSENNLRYKLSGILSDRRIDKIIKKML